MSGTCQRARISGPKRCQRKSVVTRTTLGGVRVSLCERCDKRVGWMFNQVERAFAIEPKEPMASGYCRLPTASPA